MTLLDKYLERFPNKGNAVVILSGGMDSSLSALLSVLKYGETNVHAITYFYKQKQSIEITKAEMVAKYLSIESHNLIDISFLGDIARNISSNIQGGLDMPTIREILGHPQPSTVVPNRNAILLSIAAAYAEANGLHSIVTGLQAQDQYSYWDTTGRFVGAMNTVLECNRLFELSIVAPFIETNKREEILLCQEILGSTDFLGLTITCYNPDEKGESCGICPSCSERIMAFKRLGLIDPISYQTNVFV